MSSKSEKSKALRKVFHSSSTVQSPMHPHSSTITSTVTEPTAPTEVEESTKESSSIINTESSTTMTNEKGKHSTQERITWTEEEETLISETLSV